MIAGWVSLLGRLVGRRTYPWGERTAESFERLRSLALELDADKLGVDQKQEELLGVLMETRHPQAVATLAAYADGSVSVYFSHGGGLLGLGAHEGPAREAGRWLDLARGFVDQCEATTEFPLPRPSEVRFYLLTRAGVFTRVALEEELRAGTVPLAPVYAQGHRLLAEIRAVDQTLKNAATAPTGSSTPPQR